MEGDPSSLREDLIAQGLHFLQTNNAEAASSPLSTRIAFLEQRGFSASEINETLSRLGGGAKVPAFRGILARNVAANWVINYVVIPLAVLGTGLLVYNLTGGEEVFPKPEDGAGVGAALDTNGAVVSGLAQQADEGDDDNEGVGGMSRPEDPPPLWAKELLRMSTALGQEMQAIKARLDEQAAAAKLAAEAKEAAAAAAEKVDSEKHEAAPLAVPLPDRLAAVLAAACNLKASTVSPEALQKCAGALAMYIRMLLEQPDVPRYRRISTTNDSFRTLVQVVEGHEQLLASVGFAKRGLYFEWTWADGKGGASPDGAERTRILVECLALLEKLRLEGPAAVLCPAESAPAEEEPAAATSPTPAPTPASAPTPTPATVSATSTSIAAATIPITSAAAVALSPVDAVTIAPSEVAAAASTFEEILRAAKPKA